MSKEGRGGAFAGMRPPTSRKKWHFRAQSVSSLSSVDTNRLGLIINPRLYESISIHRITFTVKDIIMALSVCYDKAIWVCVQNRSLELQSEAQLQTSKGRKGQGKHTITIHKTVARHPAQPPHPTPESTCFLSAANNSIQLIWQSQM